MPQPPTITIPTQAFTTADLLALTEYRIGAILAGAQAYGANGRQLTHADLDKLRDFRDKLRADLAAETASADGGGNVLVQFGEQV